MYILKYLVNWFSEIVNKIKYENNTIKGTYWGEFNM